jgi:hypothetical protein
MFSEFWAKGKICDQKVTKFSCKKKIQKNKTKKGVFVEKKLNL